MSQPSTLPRWADVGGNILAPTSGLQDTGYSDDAVPTAKNFNWLLNLLYLWVVYLKNLAGEAFTWTAQHTFSLAPVAPDYKFSTARTTMIPGSAGVPQAIATTVWQSGSGGELFTSAISSTPDTVNIPVVVDSGQRITVTIKLAVNAGSMSGTGTVDLNRWDGAGSPTNVGSATIAVTGVQTLTLTTNHDVVTGFAYNVSVTFGSGTSLNYVVEHVKVVHTRP